MSVLELRGISKTFGPVHALRGADFSLQPGEVHALLGENGAGKTTLMQVAFGLQRPDAGEIRVDGKTRAIDSPRVARELGIGMVHQHFTSIPALTVAENVALAAGWSVAPGRLERRVRELSERIGLRLDPEARAGRLTVGQKQRLEIVKALAGNVRILLLDEPTAVLAPAEAEELLRVVRNYTAAGNAAVLITHKLDEALTAADRVTVLRKGAVVEAGPVRNYTTVGLAEAMVGSDLPAGFGMPSEKSLTPLSITGNPLITLEALEVARESGYGLAVRGASLQVYAGEIVGVAAVEGNGQRELLRAVAGRLHPLRGRLAVASPVGFIPEDRTTEGLIPELNLTENVVLASGPSDPWVRGSRVDWALARARTDELLATYDIVAAGPGSPAWTLSGGNQQKLVVARELSRGPKVVVAENPTRGLDIRAAASIHQRLRAAAIAGAAVLFYSSDLDEVLERSDRVVVASRGTLSGVPAGASRSRIGEMMLRGGQE